MPRPRGRSNRPHPPISLAKALEVGQAIAENNASRPINRLLLAEAMGYSPSSSGFRDRLTASAKYGLTEGSYAAATISLTSKGNAAVRPRNEDERIAAKREAVHAVPLFDGLIDHFANAKLPDPDFLKNTLEREPFNVDPGWSKKAAMAFTEDAREVGYLRNIGSSPHIVIDASGFTPDVVVQPGKLDDSQDPALPEVATSEPQSDVTTTEPNGEIERPTTTDSPSRSVPMQLFVAHGSNRKPLEQLKGILNDWKVPFLVAVDEANAGRPISRKVADTMRQCSAGIFHIHG